MKRNIVLFVAILLTVNSCLPPPPPPSCSSPSGNMICFDGATYSLNESDCNLSAIYDTSNSNVPCNLMSLAFYHQIGASDPNYLQAWFQVGSYGSLDPQAGTYSTSPDPMNLFDTTKVAGTKQFTLVTTAFAINGGSSQMYNFDNSLSNTFVITNVNGTLISGHYEGQVRNSSVYSDVRELKIYFEDFSL